MKREDLIGLLINAIGLEEGHIPVVAAFLIDDFQWGPVPENKINAVKAILKTIKKQSMEHERIISGLIEYVQGSAGDEF